jgi:hypothetical protein
MPHVLRDAFMLLHHVARLVLPLMRRRRGVAAGPNDAAGFKGPPARVGFLPQADFQDTLPRIHPVPELPSAGRDGPSARH